MTKQDVDRIALLSRQLTEMTRLRDEALVYVHKIEEEARALAFENERIQPNHVTVAEEIHRREQAIAPLLTEIKKLRAELDLERRLKGPQCQCGRDDPHTAESHEIERLRAEHEDHIGLLNRQSGIIEEQRQEIERLQMKLTEAQSAVEHDLNHVLEVIAKTDPDDNSEVAELIRCHLDRWAHWGPSRLHIGLG